MDSPSQSSAASSTTDSVNLELMAFSSGVSCPPTVSPVGPLPENAFPPATAWPLPASDFSYPPQLSSALLRATPCPHGSKSRVRSSAKIIQLRNPIRIYIALRLRACNSRSRDTGKQSDSDFDFLKAEIVLGPATSDLRGRLPIHVVSPIMRLGGIRAAMDDYPPPCGRGASASCSAPRRKTAAKLPHPGS